MSTWVSSFCFNLVAVSWTLKVRERVGGLWSPTPASGSGCLMKPDISALPASGSGCLMKPDISALPKKKKN